MSPIRLTVQMPVFGWYSLRGRGGSGDCETPVETQVKALRRMTYQGKVAVDVCYGLAWIPDVYRSHLAKKDKLVDGEWSWLFVRRHDNRKSLQPFFDSGEKQWPVKTAARVKLADLTTADLFKHVAKAAEKNPVGLAMIDAALRAYLVATLGEEIDE